MIEITDTAQLPDGYFVADDANGEIYLWSGGEGSDDCQPLVGRRALDREHPALWPALLAGLAATAQQPVTRGEITETIRDAAPLDAADALTRKFVITRRVGA